MNLTIVIGALAALAVAAGLWLALRRRAGGTEYGAPGQEGRRRRRRKRRRGRGGSASSAETGASQPQAAQPRNQHQPQGSHAAPPAGRTHAPAPVPEPGRAHAPAKAAGHNEARPHAPMAQPSGGRDGGKRRKRGGGGSNSRNPFFVEEELERRPERRQRSRDERPKFGRRAPGDATLSPPEPGERG